MQERLVVWIVVMLVLVGSVIGQLELDTEGMEFNGVLENGLAKKTLRLTSDNEQLLIIDLDLSNEVKDVLSVPEEKMFVRKDIPLEIEITAKGVRDAQGLITVYAANVNHESAITTSSDTILTIPVKVSIDKKKTEGVLVNLITVSDTEAGQPINLLLDLTNTGNTEADVKIEFIMDDTIYHNKNLFAFESKRFNFKIPNNLAEGKHNSKVRVLLGKDVVAETDREFIVRPTYSLLREAEIIDVIAPDTIYVDSEEKARVYVKNKGEMPMDVRLVVTIEDSEIVKKVEEKRYIAAGELEEFKVSVDLAEKGRYVLKSTAYYMGSRTGSVQRTIKAVEKGQAIALSAGPWIMGIVLFLIILLNLRKGGKNGRKNNRT